MKSKAVIASVVAVSCVLIENTAQADIFGTELGGALRGAITGELIDGRDGAATGAVIDGLIGAGEAASREKERNQQNEAALQRKAEWEASQKAEQERIRQQQATAAPQKAAN